MAHHEDRQQRLLRAHLHAEEETLGDALLDSLVNTPTAADRAACTGPTGGQGAAVDAHTGDSAESGEALATVGAGINAVEPPVVAAAADQAVGAEGATAVPVYAMREAQVQIGLQSPGGMMSVTDRSGFDGFGSEVAKGVRDDGGVWGDTDEAPAVAGPHGGSAADSGFQGFGKDEASSAALSRDGAAGLPTTDEVTHAAVVDAPAVSPSDLPTGMLSISEAVNAIADGPCHALISSDHGAAVEGGSSCGDAADITEAATHPGHASIADATLPRDGEVVAPVPGAAATTPPVATDGGAVALSDSADDPTLATGGCAPGEETLKEQGGSTGSSAGGSPSQRQAGSEDRTSYSSITGHTVSDWSVVSASEAAGAACGKPGVVFAKQC
jgi:hypothetical protein